MRSVIERYRRPPSPFLEENQQHIPSEFFFFFIFSAVFLLFFQTNKKRCLPHFMLSAHHSVLRMEENQTRAEKSIPKRLQVIILDDNTLDTVTEMDFLSKLYCYVSCGNHSSVYREGNCC